MGLSEFRDTFIAQNQIKSRFLVLVAWNRHYLKYSRLHKGMNKKMKLIIDFVTLFFLTSLLHWHQISVYYKLVTKYNQCSSPCSYPSCYATPLNLKSAKGFWWPEKFSYRTLISDFYIIFYFILLYYSNWLIKYNDRLK